MNNILKVSILVLGMVQSSSIYALGADVVELSNGACWVSFTKDNLKLVSFNESISFNKAIDDLNEELSKLIDSKNYFANSLTVKNINLGVHCGGYGSSIVAKVETDQGEFCLWAKYQNKSFQVRSFGSSSGEKGSGACAGRKWGELLVGIENETVLSELKGEHWQNIIESVVLISHKTYKVTLKSDHAFEDLDISDLIRKKFNESEIRFIEFNEFRHPVGDYISVK